MLTLSFQSEEESLQGFLGRMFKLQKLGVCIHRFNLLWNYSNLAENDTEHYIYLSRSTGGMILNGSSFLMFTINLKALKCFSLSKQVMHTIPEECKHAVTWLC